MIPQSQTDAYFGIIAEAAAKPPKSCQRELTVAEAARLTKRLRLNLLIGEAGLTRLVRSPMVHRMGLALVGYTEDLDSGGIYLLSKDELSLLRQQPVQEWLPHVETIFKKEIACVIASYGGEVPQPFLDLAARYKIPVFSSAKTCDILASSLIAVLETALAPTKCFHGNLVVINGLGVLILGKSGIGKSDDALDLIMNGHQLVADDVVQIHRNNRGQLIGKPEELTRHHMNIRGLGIINIRELFGITALREQHTIDLVIYLETWDKNKSYACAQEEEEFEILGVTRPMLRLPIASGRVFENLIVVAVKNYLLRSQEGHNSQEELAIRLNAKIEIERRKNTLKNKAKVKPRKRKAPLRAKK